MWFVLDELLMGHGFFPGDFGSAICTRAARLFTMTEYVSQGDGFLMNDNDPTRPMVMYYHNLIMQYAEQGDVQSVSCSRASLWTRCHTSSLLRFTRGATKQQVTKKITAATATAP